MHIIRSLAFFAFVATNTIPTFCQAAALRDEFESAKPSSVWYVCNRPENKFEFGVKEANGLTDLNEQVFPPYTTMALLKDQHPGCLGSEPMEEDGDERSEIWETKSNWQRFGTEVWYRFDMFVDDSIRPDTGRYVIGQWKEAKGLHGGPLVAQRFNNRVFTVTVEQDNLKPHPNPDDILCRIFIADQTENSGRPGHGFAHDDKDKPVAPKVPRPTILAFERQEKMVAAGHSFSDDPGCTTNLTVENYNPLPDPFGHWVTMVYHLSLQPKGDSLVEIWANKKKISRTVGFIGYAGGPANAMQYFKFGSYRDPVKFKTTTKLAHFVRSADRHDVDPDGTLTPK